MDIGNFILGIDADLIEVLKKIDSLPSVQTVFIVNEKLQVVGTITDGDIRRGIIGGLDLKRPISDFIFREFSFIKEGDDNLAKLREFRKRRLKVVPLLSKEGKLLKIYNFTQLKSLLPVDAVIMAGGEGIRLRPLTEKTPKPLLKVGGREIIAYNFDRLYQFGITNQYVTVNYLAPQIEAFCSGYNEEINFRMVREPEYMGTAGSVSLIEHFENDTILLMNSDILTNIDYEDFYQSFLSEEADIMVASMPYQVSLPYAVLESDERVISSFREKPNFTFNTNAGIYLIRKKLIDLIPKDQHTDATTLLETAIQNGKKVMHYPIRGYWLDIGQHEDYEKAQKDIAHINWDLDFDQR
ncbi:MAG: NTP transferase domain-containing protein [Bacteroidetes bacterium]|nr:NTP transferase domain-containing protein [Bacteroidota bacterium]